MRSTATKRSWVGLLLLACSGGAGPSPGPSGERDATVVAFPDAAAGADVVSPDGPVPAGDLDGPSIDAPLPPEPDGGARADAAPRADSASLADGAAASPPPGCDEDGWCWVHPLPQGNGLRAVWGSGPGDVWAVGERGAIVHWDGQRWSSVPSPTKNFLRSVWGTGPTDVWAGGDHALIHWDGQRWTLMKDAFIQSIHGTRSDNVWFAQTTGYLQWNGHDLGSVLNGTGTSNGYTTWAIWAASPTLLWSVGYPAMMFAGRTAGRDVTWDIMHSVSGGVKLTAMWGTGTELWVVNDKGGIHHLVGGTLMPVTSGVDVFIGLNAVWGTAPGDIWVAGDKGTVLRGGALGFSKLAVPTQLYLYGIWGSGRDDVWAVGEAGVILHWDGQRWSTPGRVSDADLKAVWAAGPDDAWAVGTKGAILRVSGGVASLLPSGTEKDLKGVWGSAPKDVWIGGEGVVLRSVNGQLSPTAAVPLHDFTHVRGTAPDDVWLVAPGGTQHFDGQSWTTIDPGMPVVDLWPLSRDEVWATTFQKALRWTRATGKWTSFPATVYDSVWGAAPDYVWVGGSAGLQRLDGMAVRPLERPEPESYAALWGAGRDDFWAVGSLGMIVHRAADHWDHRDQRSRSTWNSLTSVWGSGDTTWVAGYGATLMRRR